MPGATIDHLISVTVFLVALLLFMSLFTQSLQAALLYQRNRQVAMKANDLLDSLALNTGYPTYWGASSMMPTSFGLQDPGLRGYHLSPFSLMRLASYTGAPVYYPKTGLWYSNVSMASGGFLLVPYTTCVNYTTAAKLLGTNGTFGFQLSLTPILTVSMTQLRANPLRISVNVMGPGLPLANAYVSYNLVRAVDVQKQYPAFELYSGDARTFANGSAILDFPSIDGSQYAYALIVNAHLGGLFGVGYLEHLTLDKQFVIPMVKTFDNGNGTATILLAHSYDVHYYGPPEAAIAYNATFLVLATDAALHPLLVGNGTITGKINYGVGKPYGQILIPNSNPGILVVTYSYGNNYGISLLPWGVGDLGVTLKYGNDPPSKDWVATDVRQVVVAGVSYQMKIAVWSLAGYQVQGARWWI
jgi:hypothetical protein